MLRDFLIKITASSYNTAVFLVGSAISATTLVYLLAIYAQVELAEFPTTVIGLYNNFKQILFFWVPDWWPKWLSDLLVLYFTIGVMVFRSTQIKIYSYYGISALAKFAKRPLLLWSLFLWPILVVEVLTPPEQFWGRQKGKDISMYPEIVLTMRNHYFVTTALVSISFVLTGFFVWLLLQWEVLKNLAGF